MRAWGLPLASLPAIEQAPLGALLGAQVCHRWSVTIQGRASTRRTISPQGMLQVIDLPWSVPRVSQNEAFTGFLAYHPAFAMARWVLASWHTHMALGVAQSVNNGVLGGPVWFRGGHRGGMAAPAGWPTLSLFGLILALLNHGKHNWPRTGTECTEIGPKKTAQHP